MRNLIFIASLFLVGCSGGVHPQLDLGPDPMADGSAYDGPAITCPPTAAECAAQIFCSFACHYDDAGVLVDGGVIDTDAGVPDLGVELDAGTDSGHDAGADPCAHGGCTADFTFPELSSMRTDVRVLENTPYWDAPANYEEKSVTLATVPYATHLDIDDIHFEGGFCTAAGDFRVLVNGTEVGTFSGVVGLRTPYRFNFAAITGTTYVVRLEQISSGSGRCTMAAASATGSTSTLSAP